MDMILNRPNRDSQRCRDPLVRQSTCHKPSNLELASRESVKEIWGRRQPRLNDSHDRRAVGVRPKDADAEGSSSQVEQRAASQASSVLVCDLGSGSTERLNVTRRKMAVSVLRFSPHR